MYKTYICLVYKHTKKEQPCLYLKCSGTSDVCSMYKTQQWLALHMCKCSTDKTAIQMPY